MWQKLRIPVALIFMLLIISGVYFSVNAKFKFNFEDFFPQGDPDLEFFQQFIQEFETDDNYYMVALERKNGIFDSTFLQDVRKLTDELKSLNNVKDAMSIASLQYPIKTPFGMATIPAVHLDQPSKYTQDSIILSKDVRFVRSMVNEDLTATAINLKIVDGIDLKASGQIVNDISKTIEKYHFEDTHMLGRAYFQKSMIEMSSREIVQSSVLAGILVVLVMIWIYRRIVPVILAVIAILLAMTGFMTYIGISGQALSTMAGLYPILMIIVSTSDIIHMLSKYIEELQKGRDRSEAIKVTIKEIGLATFLTSITTSVGFATLLFSKLEPIKEVGINAAVGVMIAFGVIVLFSAVFFPLFGLESFSRKNKSDDNKWGGFLDAIYGHTLHNKKQIRLVLIGILIISAVGLTMVTTNYRLENNLPRNQKITNDYNYFEDQFSGFRPLDIAVEALDGRKIDNFEVLQEIHKVEKYLEQYSAIKSVVSYTTVAKSLNRMMNGNKESAFTFPKEERTFNSLMRYANSIPKSTTAILVNDSMTKSRISSRIDDIGAETIQQMAIDIDQWIKENVKTDIAKFTLTGTALLFDKNTFMVRDSLLKGLGFAALIVSVIMMLLFRDWRMLIISIVPNILPLVISGAIIGFAGIELEAGISIVFAIAFGIAVDDTIHFLSKYKIELDKGIPLEEAIHVTFKETGKAIVVTTIILFFGFMVMFFSSHPPSRSIGILISATLVSALFSDLYFIPGLIRFFHKRKGEKESISNK